MPGPQVGIFWDGYTSDPLDMDIYRTAAVMMQGARPRFITDEANMPDGRQREEFSQWAGHLMGYVEKVEPLVQDLEPITSLGILFSETTRDHLRAAAESVLVYRTGLSAKPSGLHGNPDPNAVSRGIPAFVGPTGGLAFAL
jgi:hypothetical protein